ncbi:FG-GAP-like repeat-containing protein [Georgenia faecalis]|uniref:FG-GAP-like repeat-containing protein n=1 Tax=Georgenia faecalis TaxID=2483799 RepID=UPI0013DECCA0|nr:FG-GAP-like repeat-containing protein [Georgenia faecalis]
MPRHAPPRNVRPVGVPPARVRPDRLRPAFAVVLAMTLLGALLVPTSAHAATALTSRDYTGDGRTDVLTVSPSGQLGVYAGTGSTGVARSTLVGNGWTGYTPVRPGDFNGDGVADLLAVAPQGQLYFYAGRGGTFAGRVQIGHGWQDMTNVFSPGDFSGDGIADVLATAPGGELYLYPGNDAGRLTARTQIGHGWQVYTDVFDGGDLNGDGRADLLARDGDGRLFAYYGTGAGRMSSRVQVGNGWVPYTQVSSVGDLTGDGQSDVFAIHASTGQAYVYPGTGRGSFTARVALGTGWRAPAKDARYAYERGRLFSSLNSLRASRGLAALTRSDELDARAQAWADHMAQTRVLVHSPNFRTEMTAAGWAYKSELIVRNTGGRSMTTDAILTYMHNWWVASPDHYPWMVSPNYTHVGHGYTMGSGGPYAVTVLGGR